MSLRGKRLGLWMTVGTASFSHVPVFYQALTSSPVARVASLEIARSEGLGFAKLKETIGLHLDAGTDSAADSSRDWKGELVKYMEKKGLYAIHEGVLEVVPGSGGMETVRGDIVIPARAPGGRYEVSLIGFRNGAPVARAEAAFSVQLVGAVAFLRNLAFEHGWLYGIMAVIVALASGLGVGALMPSKGGRSGK